MRNMASEGKGQKFSFTILLLLYWIGPAAPVARVGSQLSVYMFLSRNAALRKADKVPPRRQDRVRGWLEMKGQSLPTGPKIDAWE